MASSQLRVLLSVISLPLVDVEKEEHEWIHYFVESCTALDNSSLLQHFYYGFILYPGILIAILFGCLIVFRKTEIPGSRLIGILLLMMGLHLAQFELDFVKSTYALLVKFYPISFIALWGLLVVMITDQLLGVPFKTPKMMIFGSFPLISWLTQFLSIYSYMGISFATFKQIEEVSACLVCLAAVWTGKRALNNLNLHPTNQSTVDFEWLHKFLTITQWFSAIWIIQSGIAFLAIGFSDRLLNNYVSWITIVIYIIWILNIEFTRKHKVNRKDFRMLSREDIRDYVGRIILLVEKEKLYLNPDLTLRDLASLAGTDQKTMSLILNEGIGKNFNDFINGYRIKEVQHKLLDPMYDHYTHVAIGLDCGFNSKSSFNMVFKKFARMTPSEFKQKFKKKSA